MCRADHHSTRRKCPHPPAKVPQTLAHLCLSHEPVNQVLRALKRFFSPRRECYSGADGRVFVPAVRGPPILCDDRVSITEPIENHPSPEIRGRPIFPELRLILDEAFEIFGDKCEYVVAAPRYRAAADAARG